MSTDADTDADITDHCTLPSQSGFTSTTVNRPHNFAASLTSPSSGITEFTKLTMGLTKSRLQDRTV